MSVFKIFTDSLKSHVQTIQIHHEINRILAKSSIQQVCLNVPMYLMRGHSRNVIIKFDVILCIQFFFIILYSPSFYLWKCVSKLSISTLADSADGKCCQSTNRCILHSIKIDRHLCCKKQIFSIQINLNFQKVNTSSDRAIQMTTVPINPSPKCNIIMCS